MKQIDCTWNQTAFRRHSFTLILIMSQPVRTTRRAITRGLCSTFVEETMSKLVSSSRSSNQQGATECHVFRSYCFLRDVCLHKWPNPTHVSWANYFQIFKTAVFIHKSDLFPLCIVWSFGFAECHLLFQNDHCSLAGEFFPEAAQIAYKMWELSASTKVQVWASAAPTVDVSACWTW